MGHHQRLSINDADPSAYPAVLGMERYVQGSGLPKALYELVKIRASQLNGCAFCLDMHNRDARAGGEDQRRLDVVSAWREAPRLFSEQEQAALALTEAVTLISRDGVPDEVWENASKQFGDTGMVHLLMAIATINVWNRLAVSTHQDLPELAATTSGGHG
ncbi:MAG: carboxymuconolactone decarboxylase family protein [Acidimicrobiales bacterium]